METTRGGKRKGAGRKPAENPKVRISLYVEKKKIWLFGNEKKLLVALSNFINNYGQEAQQEKPQVPTILKTEIRYEPIDEGNKFDVEDTFVPSPEARRNPFLEKVERKKWAKENGFDIHPRLKRLGLKPNTRGGF